MRKAWVNPNLLFLREKFDLPFRIYRHEGGTRSGKTYSILQFLIELCYLYPNAGMEIDVVRKTRQALKATAYKDFLEILQSFGGYSENFHNMSDLIYILNGNTFNFYSLDEPKKVRGRKRHILYVNEANEIDFESWKQLLLRTSHKVIADYNPSDFEHFLYDLDSRKDAALITSTYLDNPHLTEGQVFEIEQLKITDPDSWAVFGLGERGTGLKGRIYTHFQPCDNVPESLSNYPSFYGLDFGFNDPLALIEVKLRDNIVWVKEHIYQTGLTMEDVYKYWKANGLKGSIIADAAGAEQIETLRRFGLNIKKCNKGKDSIENGIKLLKQKQVFYDIGSTNIKKESLHYKWELDYAGNPTDEPIDKYNHAMDAIRYAVESKVSNKSSIKAFTC